MPDSVDPQQSVPPVTYTMDCPDASGTTPAEMPCNPQGIAAFRVQVFGASAAARPAADTGSVPGSGWVGLRSSAQAVRARAPSASTSWLSGERTIGLLLGGSKLLLSTYPRAVKRISSGFPVRRTLLDTLGTAS